MIKRAASFSNKSKMSLSLSNVLHRAKQKTFASHATFAAGFAGEIGEVVKPADSVSVLIEANHAYDRCEEFCRLINDDRLTPLAGDQHISAHIDISSVSKLIGDRRVKRIQTKKRKALHLTEALDNIGLTNGVGGARTVQEDGNGVLIGVVDSGFDLTHPMFWNGNDLRVEGLLDQVANRSFTRNQLINRLNAGGDPGADEVGHGTHVASIAGGSLFSGFEGVATGARFLLVKTDMLNTEDAVDWVFNQAGNQPCVVNLSLGHHYGAHDGTDAEERFHDVVSGPGKIVVVSAGNAANDRIHIGSRFFSGQREIVGFEIGDDRVNDPSAPMTLWFPREDSFDVALITPGQQSIDFPNANRTDQYTGDGIVIDVARGNYAPSNLVQLQLQITIDRNRFTSMPLRGWALEIRCTNAVVGRLDGWFANSGFGEFDNSALVEWARTVGIAATGQTSVSVASHVSGNAWDSDDGDQHDPSAVVGRVSAFSSRGPTRDDRWKPDISGPGQYVTAALAEGSQYSGFSDRALVHDRLLTIEGTSMAAPVVTGAIACMLQKRGNLTPAEVKTALWNSAIHDIHTGPGQWNPAYGFGKLSLDHAMDEI